MMTRLCSLVLSVGLLLALSPVSAQEARPGEISFGVQVPGYHVGSSRVEVPGFDYNDVPGAPALPVWNKIVELPPDGVWEVSYHAPGAHLLEQRVDITSVPVPELPLPGPRGWAVGEDLPGPVSMVQRPDPAIYDTDAFYPESPVVSGAVQWHQGRRLLALHIFPFQYNAVTRQLYYHPDLQISVTVADTVRNADDLSPDQATSHISADASAATQSALRIRTGTRGLYRLSYGDLLAAGVPLLTTDPATFAMSYLGQPIAIEVTGDGDPSFEPDELVIFYAEPYQGRYQASNVYWFVYGGEPGNRIQTRMVTPTGSEPVLTTITQTLHVEFDREYRGDYPRPKDADHWFDTPLSPDVLTNVLTATRTYDLALDDALTNGNVRIRSAMHGVVDRPADPDNSIAIHLNSYPVGTYQWEGKTYYTATATAPAAWLDGAPNQLSLVAAVSQLPDIEFYSVAPDWVELVYPALADAEGDHIYVESIAPGASQVSISGFTTPDVEVYDVRKPRHPVRLLTTEAKLSGASYTFSFWDANLPGPTYMVSSRAALLAPLVIEADTPSIWGTPDHTADYIAIVHPSLWTAIQPLLDHRMTEGLSVVKVDIQDIYDEFGYGRRDPEAIRSFLTYAYHNWNGAGRASTRRTEKSASELYSGVSVKTGRIEMQRDLSIVPPQYVLLVGDGHYDFTGVSGTTLPNLIPPYLVDVDPFQGETAADNRYVSVDGPDDYLPDMHIGRIPANSPANVTNVINKIIAYETTAPSGDWQNRVVFVADNNTDPAGNFHVYSDEVRLNLLPASYDDRTIYYNRDYFTSSDMRTAIKAAFDEKALMLQWFGHAGTYRWGSVSMFNTSDPPALAANNFWPFTVSYSCWSGNFPYLFQNRQSLGETLLLTPQRGSVADLSPSGLHVGDSLLILNEGLVQAVFQQRIQRVGEAVDAARLHYFGHSASFHDIIDTYIFFGDPALRLRLPTPPLSVDLTTFSAEARDDGVLITWETVSEHDNLGFNLYRSESPHQAGELLAFVPSQIPGGGQGARYEYLDATITHGQTYWYTLDAVDPSGETTRYGPVSATSHIPTAVELGDLQAASAAMAGPSLRLFSVLLVAVSSLAIPIWMARRHGR